MVKVPLLDLKAQYTTIRSEIQEAIERVCESQHFILGPEVAGLEQEVAAFCGAPLPRGVLGNRCPADGVDGVGVRPGDEVITTSYSFFATAGVIARLGARPVFVISIQGRLTSTLPRCRQITSDKGNIASPLVWPLRGHGPFASERPKGKGSLSSKMRPRLLELATIKEGRQERWAMEVVFLFSEQESWSLRRRRNGCHRRR